MSKEFFKIKSTKELCRHLGVSEIEASKIEMRRNLVVSIGKTISKNNWTHTEAAERGGVGRTVITAIMNGNLDKISTDRLIDIAQNIGLQVTLKAA